MKLVIIGAVALGLSACAATGPYRGRVVDAETKQPLVGAVVLVYWNRLTPGLGHGPVERFLGADETLTNIHGEFIVAEDPPIVWAPWAWRSRPHFTIFLPGYAFFPRHAQTIPPYRETGLDELLKIMETRHVVFELPRLVDYKSRTQAVLMVDPLVIPYARIPLLVQSLNEERRRLHLPPVSETRMREILR
jgi:hypothetical protein